MVYDFTLNSLIYPTSAIFLIGFGVIIFYLKSIKLAFFISTIKASIFFIYFFYFFDGSFTFLDDVKYFTTASEYINRGETFLNLISSPLNLIYIFGHFHFLYYLYNILSIEIFGNYYFAPVAMNVIITYFTGVIFYKLLLLLKLNHNSIVFITVLYLLHWDILAWSSIVNFKDFIVQFITISILYLLVKNDIRFSIINILLIAILVLNVTFLRFYIPYFILFAYLIFKIFIKYQYSRSNKSFYLLFLSLFIITIGIILNLFFRSEVNLFLNHVTNPLIGMVRFIMTPLPFHMEEGYDFLLFSSLIDFLSLPLFLYGLYLFSRLNSKYKYLILIYFLIILFFYGSFAELQGPRHKIQILPFIILFQGLGYIKIIQKILYRKHYAKNNIPN